MALQRLHYTQARGIRGLQLLQDGLLDQSCGGSFMWILLESTRVEAFHGISVA